MVIAAALAARTTRLKIGSAVHVLPLSNPLRTAEEAATVDHISHGRFEFGIGRSGFPATYERFGVPYGESRDRLFEHLEIIRKAWTEETFSHQGEFFSYENITLIPKPYQKPHPPIRIAVNSPDTYAVAGRMGLPIFVAVRLGSLMDLVEPLREYRAAWKEAGHPGEGDVALRLPVFVGRTRDAALAIPCESTMGSIASWASASSSPPRAPAPAPSRAARSAARAWAPSPTRRPSATSSPTAPRDGDRSPAAAPGIARRSRPSSPR